MNQSPLVFAHEIGRACLQPVNEPEPVDERYLTDMFRAIRELRPQSDDGIDGHGEAEFVLESPL
jgi:hypothetical protein